MSVLRKAVFAFALLVAGSYLGSLVHAQRPAELDSTGAAYMRVNINPTEIPPMVNINPYGAPPKVAVTEMPPPPPLASRASLVPASDLIPSTLQKAKIAF